MVLAWYGGVGPDPLSNHIKQLLFHLRGTDGSKSQTGECQLTHRPYQTHPAWDRAPIQSSKSETLGFSYSTSRLSPVESYGLTERKYSSNTFARLAP